MTPYIVRMVNEGIVEEYISHLLTKPLNGGIPDIEREAIRAEIAVTGISLAKPPKTLRFLKPVL